MMILKDMKRTPAEVQEEKVEYASPEVPLYPYGLCLYLDEDTLATLGIDMPSAGEMLSGAFQAKVTSVSERDTDEGVCRRVELQIQQLGFETVSTASPEERRYGSRT